MNVRGWFLLVACSFLSGFFIGCGDVTATMISPAADVAQLDAGAGAKDSRPESSQLGADAGTEADSDAAAAGGETAATSPPDAGAELRAEHPNLNCVPRQSADYRTTVCEPGCGTCQIRGELTFAAGCWTADDFHCVSSCAECP